MKVIFDEERAASHPRACYPADTPKILVERKITMLTKLGEFMGADSIELKDAGMTEFYIITKGEKTLNINIRLKNDHYADPPNEAWLEIS